MIDPDGTNRVNLTDFANLIDRPSVSEQTGMVAFEGSDLKITPPLDFQDHRIFVMNADGTGIKQITFAPNPGSNARSTLDSHPKISPDGTKVAFVSLRTAGQIINCPNSTRTTTENREVWVVNVDGSNLHQVTTAQVSFDTGGGCSASDNAEVAWSGNSQLVVMGQRPYTFKVMPRSPGLFNSLNMVTIAGGTETLLALDFPEPNPGQPDEPVTRAVIAPRDGNGVGFLDCSASGTILFSSTMNNQNGSFGQMGQGGQPTYTLSQNLMGQGALVWDVRYSPDGAHLLIAARSPSFAGDFNTHLFIDGGGGMVQNTASVADLGAEWAAGPPIATPNSLVLSPKPLFLYGHVPVRITPTLLDPQNNVIVRTAQWRVDGAGFRCDNTPDEIPCVGTQPLASNAVDFTGLVKGTTSELQGNLCGINAGVMGCTPYFNTQSSAFLSINTTNPTAFTSGTGGPGVFTIKREGAPPTQPPISVSFIASGTAVRDVDYTLDFSGNTIVLPSGQTSVNINVRPLRAQTADKTVIIALQADPLKNYTFSALYNSSATVTIRNDGVSTAISLLRITPNTGGDQGVVTATVYGQNIHPGATVRLSRNGEADIIGENATVAADSSISALFNLMGRAQGTWDVVVTNPDSSFAKIIAGFNVQPTQDVDVWVDISGRDAIRASHTATTYTILVGNRGNVDAFAVPVFITGIPLNAEVQLLSSPKQLQGITNSSLSPVVKNDAAQSIPMLVPIVRAGSTNYYRIAVRSDHFNDGEFDLSVFALKPLAQPVIQAVANPTVVKSEKVSGLNLSHARLTKTVVVNNSFTAFLASPDGISCLGALFQAGLNCASILLPQLAALKGGECFAGMISFMGGLASTVASDAAGAPLKDNESGWIAIGQIPLSAAQTFTGCLAQHGLQDLASIAPVIGNILGGISCGLSLYDAIKNSCYSKYLKFKVRTILSNDPNEKVGPRGGGDEHYVQSTSPLTYSLFFENQATASAPAQTVVVTDQIDASKVDLTTFSLGLIGFGNKVVVPPGGLKTYDTDVDLRPGQDLIVRIHAALDNSSGVVTWKFQSIDPATNQPTTNPTAGFLPPDTDGIVGEGSVLFNVMPKVGLGESTQISNKARITFDLNAALDTNTFTNTIDNSLPMSHVAVLDPTQRFLVFKVNWNGADVGSGLRDYTVYVSENGGPYTIWLHQTTQTSAYFIGQPGKIYSFYTIATDNAGNQEAVKTTSEANTGTRTDIGNGIDDSRYLVWQHYSDFLNRVADDAGFDFWTNEIEGCGIDTQCRDVKRVNVSAAFFLSIEFQQTGYLVERIYKSAYGNATGTSTFGGTHQLPVPVIRRSEFQLDATEIGDGVVVNQPGWEQKLESNKQVFALGFVQRARFIAAFPTTLTPTQYVDQLFANAGVTPSSTERAVAIGEFGTANDSSDVVARARALRRVAENSTLVRQEFNRAFVLMQYFGYLRRNPNDAPEPTLDYTGYDFWLTKLNQFNGDYVRAEMVKAFIVSSEYRQRFGP